MSLIAGSYERFIWGFSVRKPKNQTSANENPQTLNLIPLFSYPSHLSPVKSVAVAGPIAASSAADDSLKLYDLSTCTELGSLLTGSASSVNALSFFTPLDSIVPFPRNLIAGSDDGSVSIYDADPFVLLKTVPVHRKAINDLAVHPSGKLALTVSKDPGLGMVNLITGRRSFRCLLSKEANVIGYGGGSGSGERFFMAAEEKVTVNESEDAKVVWEFDCPKRVLCVASGENGVLFTGGEDKGITAWDSRNGKRAYAVENAHSSRVKGIVVLGGEAGAEFPHLVASASSDGTVRVWDVRSYDKEKPTPLCEVNTKSRLTCLAGAPLKSTR